MSGDIAWSRGLGHGQVSWDHQPRQGPHLDAGVLDQAELLLDLVEFLLLPPDVGLQDARPLLQLVFDGLEHAELWWELPSGVRKHNQIKDWAPPHRHMFCCSEWPYPLSPLSFLHLFGFPKE